MNNRNYAILAGASLLLMAVAAGYAYGYVFSSLVNQADGTETLQNIQTQNGTFMGGVIGWVVIFILDLIVSWAIWKYFELVNRLWAMITAGARLVYSAMLGVGIYQLAHASSATTGDKVMELIGSFESLWSLGLIVFGFHLLGWGKLALEAGGIHKIFGWLLLIAGVCYVGVHAAKALYPGSMEQILEVETVLSLPMAIGELAFALWFLIKGGKTKPAV